MHTGDQGTEATSHPRQTTLRVRAATIEVREGPDVGRHARVDTPCFVVGSGAQADLRLLDKTVSREHIRLAVTEGGVQLRDRESRNGTWIGPTRVQEALITSDVALRIGDTTLALRLDGSTSELIVSDRDRFGDAVARSPAMRHVFAILERVADSDVTILLEGESGVGKEVLAQGIHRESARGDGPFVTVDCGAIPAGLVESELFGHARGAFTGAHQVHVGVTEQAHGGTLFFDEIGELPLELQPKLLRFLETREVRPVGSPKGRFVDVRIISATNRRLSAAVEKGHFRADLFYRLSVARVTVPPLRDRPEDVSLLAALFMQKSTRDAEAKVPDDLDALLVAYPWPGNVRELRNVIERYAVLGVRDSRGLFDHGERAPDNLVEGALLGLDFHEARRRTLERFERAYLTHALAQAKGVVTRAAEIAGIARPSFYRMLHRLGGQQPADDEGGPPASSIRKPPDGR